MRYIKPLDRELILTSIKKGKIAIKRRNIITIEDGIRNGGLSTLIREMLINEKIKTMVFS